MSLQRSPAPDDQRVLFIKNVSPSRPIIRPENSPEWFQLTDSQSIIPAIEPAILLRSFLGGRHKDDRGLYVSTGGFSKDARYEADHASIPVMLWDLDDLVRYLIENYELLDAETKQLVPLKRVYWPA